jgi:hypothetical protein
MNNSDVLHRARYQYFICLVSLYRLPFSSSALLTLLPALLMHMVQSEAKLQSHNSHSSVRPLKPKITPIPHNHYFHSSIIGLTIREAIIGFGLSAATNSWIASSGELVALSEMAAIAFFVLSLWVPMFFYGARLRRWSLGWRCVQFVGWKE